MGGGPKASAANLEPLGKRRVFGAPVVSSKIEACTSSAHDVTSAPDKTIVSSTPDNRSSPHPHPEETATGHTERKVNTTSDASTQLVYAASCNLMQPASPPSATNRDHNIGQGERPEPPTAAEFGTKARAPTPRTRLETSARALAIAQEWQAKFKGLSQKPLSSKSQPEINIQKQSAGTRSEQHIRERHESQQLPLENTCTDEGDTAAIDEVNDEPPRKLRRKSGLGPQASAANLEPLGNRKRGCPPEPRVVDDVSPPPVLEQRLSTKLSVNQPAFPVQSLQLDTEIGTKSRLQPQQHTPSMSTETATTSNNQAIERIPSSQSGRGTVAAVKRHTSIPKDHRHDADEHRYSRSARDIDYARPQSSGHKMTDDIEKRENTARKRKRSSSPYQKSGGRHVYPDRRYDSNNKSDRPRDGPQAKAGNSTNSKSWNEAYPREAYAQHTSSTKEKRTSHNDRVQDPMSNRVDRRESRDNSYRDPRRESDTRNDHSYHRDNSPQEMSRTGSHRHRRDISAPPRRFHYDLQGDRDYHRNHNGEHRYRGDYDRHSHGQDRRQTRTSYDSREYQYRNPRHLYDEKPRLVRHGRYESDRRGRSRSPDYHHHSLNRSGCRYHAKDDHIENHRDHHYRKGEVNRR